MKRRRFLGQMILCILVAGWLSACRMRAETDSLHAGLAAMGKGQYKEAAKFLEKAAVAEPGDATVCANLGIAYWRLQEPELAIVQLQKASALAPDDPRPLEFLAAIYMGQNCWKEAQKALHEAYQHSPLQPRILTARAQVELHLLGVDSALIWLKQALAISPAYPPALYTMGVLYRDWIDNPVVARTYFDKFLKVAGNDSHAEEVRRYLQGLVAARDRNTSAANAPPADAVSALAAVRAALANEAYDEARIRLKRGLEKFPRDADLLWEEAVLQDRRRGSERGAVLAYREFLRQFPADRRAAEARTRLEAQEVGTSSARKDGARAHLTDTFTPTLRFKQPSRRDARAAVESNSRGLQCYQKRDWDRAIYYFTQAIEADPQLINAYYNLGLAYKNSRDMPNARDAFLYALQIDPNMHNARYMLALVWRELNQPDQSIFHLSQVLAAQPTYAEAHLALGLIYQKTGSPELGRSHLIRYLELAPTGASAEDVRKILRVKRPDAAGLNSDHT